MCESCWAERGSPRIDTPRVREAAALIAKLYYVSSSGGMHVQLDDWNIDDERSGDSQAGFSGDSAKDICQPHFERLSDEERALALETHAAMCVLTVEERASALALEEGYWA
jgi:hypothetical protein